MPFPVRVGARETPLTPRGMGTPASSQKVGSKSEQSITKSVLDPFFSFD